MPHLHVPLQSGCDRTLAAMRRGYDTASYADAVARARDAIPALSVTTDVIVGFPGESDEDFAESMAFVRACGFARIHVFRYSRRAGTPAAAMGDQVPPDVSAARARDLRELGEHLASRRAAGRVGERARVLVERVTEGSALGTSEDYLRVTVHLADGQRPRHGDIVVAELTAAQRGQAWGLIAEC